MSYQKTYGRINWENYPSDKTPLNEANLNKIDYAVNEVDNRILELDVKKLDLAVANGMVKSLAYNQANGVFTITYLNGSSDTIDTKMEKLAVNFSYDPTAQQLIITLDDGTTQKVDLSALITQYEFSDTDTVAFSVDGGGKVSANVKNGSITEDKLRPNYLADIKVEVAKAQSSAAAAASSETNAKASENAAKTSETNAKTSETNAAGSASTASTKAAAAADSASAAAASESNALNSAKTASDKATAASNSATTATSKANEASASASNAASSASTAASKASEASDCATAAESYAHGGTGTRAGEDTDNAAYYYHQSKSISESFAGALRPMGTVTFASLPSLENAASGDMYNISDEFTTTAEFKEGSGNVIPAGANVYKTADGYWDVLAGSPVTGVKGDAEPDYHRGNINLTPENIGLGNVPNVATNDQTPTFTEAEELVSLTSGEKLSTIFGKLSKAVTELIRHISTKATQTVANQHPLGHVQVYDAIPEVNATNKCVVPSTYAVAEALNGKANSSHTHPYLPSSYVVNNNTTTVAGYALDARQANPNVAGSLGAQIASLKSGKLTISKHGALHTPTFTGGWSTVVENGVSYTCYYTGCCVFLSDKKCDIHIDILFRDNIGTSGGTATTHLFNMDALRGNLSMSTLTFSPEQTDASIILGAECISDNDAKTLLNAMFYTANLNFSFLRFTSDGRLTRQYWSTNTGITYGNMVINNGSPAFRQGNIARVNIYAADYT